MHGIRERVNVVRSRQQRQWLWRCLSWGLVAGGVGAALYGMIAVAAGGAASWTWIAAALVAGPLLGGVFAIARPRALRDAAVAIDRSCSLKDRVATALHLMTKTGSDSPVRELQLADAEKHLASVDPAVVAPIKAPRPWYWGLAFAAAALVVGFLGAPQEQTVAAVVANDVVVAQANRVDESLEELKKFNNENTDPELEKLLKELTAKIEELKQPGLEPKEALAKLSEMEAALQKKQAQLSDPDTMAALQSVGEALSLAAPFQSAGQAMSQGEMEKAADELAMLDLPELDRQTEKAITEKLDKVGENASDGSQKKLKEAVSRMAKCMRAREKSSFKDSLDSLASECKKAGRRKKLSDILRKQCQCLGECKSECEGECKSPGGMGNNKGGQQWGLGASGNAPGDKTPKLKTKPQMNITGQESDDGDVDVETMTAPEQQQEAVREYRAKAEEYEQLSESVLDAEPIPLGHRQTIRRYFEMIRPQEAETDAVQEATDK